MAGFKKAFFKIARIPGAAIPNSFLARLTRQQIIHPFYHTVSDETLPHLKHLYEIKNSRQFENDLDFLLSQFQAIDFFEFRNRLDNPGQKHKPAFLLSFDDGLREFNDVIAPILLRKGVPAICFLNSGFLDNRDLFFRYKASLLVDQFRLKPGLKENPKVKDWEKRFNKNGAGFREILLKIDYSQKDKLDELAYLAGFDFQNFLRNQQPYLNRQQVHSLIQKGFHFGAHSVDHPEYRFIRPEEQMRQTAESIHEICEAFKLDYKIFSFPFTDFGVPEIFFNKIFQENIADFTFGCAGMKNEKISRHFQRIALEDSNRSAKEIFRSEMLYYLCKIPFGKNTVRRS